MRFTIPQFIEYETKIVGPLTFRQFIFIAIAGAICFVIYFTLPFSIFLLSCFVFGGIAVSFAFLQFGGRPLPTIVGNFLKFNISPKIYIWKKKEIAIFFKKAEMVKKESDEELPLKIAGKSQLKKIKTEIETRTK